MLSTILMVFAFVLLVCAALGYSPPKPQLGWLGLALWVLAIILSGVHLTGLAR